MKNSVKAAIATAFGQPLVIGEMARPTPQPGEILLRTAVCGVHRRTTLLRCHAMWRCRKRHPSCVPG